MTERTCNFETRGNTCTYCLFDHNGDCARGLKPGRIPWSAWRDEDPTSNSQDGQQRASPPKDEGNVQYADLLKSFYALTDKVGQNIGLTQHLRNEVTELHKRKYHARGKY